MTQAPDNASAQTSTKNLIEVENTTGQKIQLLHERERDFYEAAKDKYLADYKFTHANDYRTLDRLLSLEVQCFRYQWFTLADIDYEANLLLPKEATEYRRAIKEIQSQIADCQKDLGVTKAERERASSVDDVGSYVTELLQRAKEFGVNRETQLDKALTLTQELFSMVGSYRRSNEQERRKLGIENAEQILDWVQEYMEPEFNLVDEHFRNREDGQKYWIRRM